VSPNALLARGPHDAVGGAVPSRTPNGPPVL